MFKLCSTVSIRSIKVNCALVDSILTICIFTREETEIIEGEVVEIQIDRPASGTVSNLRRNVMLCCKPGDIDVDVFLIIFNDTSVSWEKLQFKPQEGPALMYSTLINAVLTVV